MRRLNFRYYPLCNLTSQGPFTVRVQEPGGTFDTEVNIEDYYQCFEILYHTKYKRIRKKPLKKSKKGGQDGMEEEEEEEEEEEVEDELESRLEMDEGASEMLISEPDRYISHKTVYHA